MMTIEQIPVIGSVWRGRLGLLWIVTGTYVGSDGRQQIEMTPGDGPNSTQRLTLIDWLEWLDTAAVTPTSFTPMEARRKSRAECGGSIR